MGKRGLRKLSSALDREAKATSIGSELCNCNEIAHQLTTDSSDSALRIVLLIIKTRILS
jgi:hypothetical protein